METADKNTTEIIYNNILKDLILRIEEKQAFTTHAPDKCFTDKESLYKQAKAKTLRDAAAIFNQFLQDKI